jgi:hypothetical protein
MADEFSALLAQIGDENAFHPDALLAAAIAAPSSSAPAAASAAVGADLNDNIDLSILPTSPADTEEGDADVMPSSSPHLNPYLAAADVGPSDVADALEARYDVVFCEGDVAEDVEPEVEGSDTEAEHEEEHHLWSVRPGHWGRSTDLDWHEQKRLKHEQETAEAGNLSWQERGPVPKKGAERPGFWRGQAWRAGSERWSNRGGRYREYYQWMARTGNLKGGKSSSSGDGSKGGKSSGSGDGYKGGKSSGPGKGDKGQDGKSSGSGKGDKGKDGQGKGGK